MGIESELTIVQSYQSLLSSGHAWPGSRPANDVGVGEAGSFELPSGMDNTKSRERRDRKHCPLVLESFNICFTVSCDTFS